MTLSRLQECIDLVVEAALSERLRGNFDLRALEQITGNSLRHKADKIMAFVKAAGLQLVHCGSQRCTYILSSGKALKVGYKGDNYQNQQELKSFFKFGREYVPEIFTYDTKTELWMVLELARPFQHEEVMRKETGISEYFLFPFAQWAVKSFRNEPVTEEMVHEFIKWNTENNPWSDLVVPEQLTPQGLELLSKFLHLHKNDVSDIDRADHWGFAADRRIVCLDMGLADG